MEDDTGQTSILGEPMQAKAEYPEPSEARKALVTQIQDKIQKAKVHWETKVFNKMRANQKLVRDGKDGDVEDVHFYRANLAHRHVQTRVATLYAKNPTAAMRLKERLVYTVWDERPATLELSEAVLGMAQQYPGQLGGLEGQLMQARAIVEDFTQGREAKEMFRRFGRTLQILFLYSMNEQVPGFKKQMKRLVRRVLTNSVGYVKLDYQREYQRRPDVESRIADVTARLSHIERLMKDAAEGEIDETAAEAEDLRLMLGQLQQEQQVLKREGLVFNFPFSTNIIPDPETVQLDGWLGSDWLAEEFPMTCEAIKETWGTDVEAGGEGSGTKVNKRSDGTGRRIGDAVLVWEYYDRKTGLVYTVADGYCDFLEEPRPPNVRVEQFFPVYPLIFNDIEDETNPFPLSDVELIQPMQRAYNSARQGLVEHRQFSRPRWVTSGMLDEDEEGAIKTVVPFSILRLKSIGTGQKISDLFQPLPPAPIDPNVYQTEQYLQDTYLVVGSDQPSFGMAGDATATASAIAQASRTSSTDSNIDDLDDFLSLIARDGGQILLAEMSKEKVTEIVGPGAVWPEFSAEDIAKEIYLDIEAGSSGRPNKAEESANFERFAPTLIQLPNIDPVELAKEGLTRFDDRLDLDRFIKPGVPSIVAMNGAKTAATGDPATDPAQQGPQGANNNPAPAQNPTPQVPMGNNQQ